MLCCLEEIVGRALTLHVVTKVYIYYFISPILCSAGGTLVSSAKQERELAVHLENKKPTYSNPATASCYTQPSFCTARLRGDSR